MSQSTLLSPRLSVLPTQLARDPAALERFWQEIAEHGTPLIELDGSDQALVTRGAGAAALRAAGRLNQAF